MDLFVEARLVEVFFADALFVVVLFVADFFVTVFPGLVFRGEVLRAVFLAAVLREVADFLAARFLPACLPADFPGTFSPSSLASDRAIAMACLREVTFLPLPLFNVPRFLSRITLPPG